MDVPLEILDREVERAAAELGAARAALARSASDDDANPLADHRRVSTRATWIDLADATGPLAAPLRAWVYALTLERVTWEDTARLAAARRTPSIAIAETGIAPMIESPRAMIVRVLREGEIGRRRILAGALARGAVPVHDAARILWERRAEAARLLGADVDAMEVPVDPPSAIHTIAARFLADTAPLLDRGDAWHSVLAASVGRAFGEGWPARLTTRWLFELFHGGPLTEGLVLQLPDLPAPLGASSFARALATFGAALADADGPSEGRRTRSSTPFAIARAPFDLKRARRSALFASLAADATFGMRALGLGRGRALDQARGVARAMLVTLRLDAARVLCRGALAASDAERASRFEEHTREALGAPIPQSLAGVLPSLGPEDPTRFAGALLAASDRTKMIDRFDEDWFRNPHAARALREEDARVAPPRTAAAALEEGASAIVRELRTLA